MLQWFRSGVFVGGVLFVILLAAEISHGDFLVAENQGTSANTRVLRFADDGTFLSVLVDVDGGLSGGVGLVIDPNGDLLVASQNTNQIRRYNSMTGEFLSQFGDGTGLNGPSHLGFDPSTGHLLVSNFGGGGVSAYEADGTFIGSFTSGGPALDGVTSFEFDNNGDFYVGDFYKGDVFKYNANGVFQSVFSDANNTGFFGVTGFTFDGTDLLLSSLLTQQVARLDSSGQVVSSFLTGNFADPNLPLSPSNGDFPSQIMVSPFAPDELLIALTGGGGVYRFSNTGTLLSPFLTAPGMLVPGEFIRVAAIPEPASLPILVGLIGLCIRRRRRLQ